MESIRFMGNKYMKWDGTHMLRRRVREGDAIPTQIWNKQKHHKSTQSSCRDVYGHDEFKIAAFPHRILKAQELFAIGFDLTFFNQQIK